MCECVCECVCVCVRVFIHLFKLMCENCSLSEKLKQSLLGILLCL